MPSSRRHSLPPHIWHAIVLATFTSAAAGMILAGCSSGPPAKEQARLTAQVMPLAQARGLVDIRSVAPDILVDLRYHTKENVTRQSLYPKGMPCLLHRGTAAKLIQAQATLKSRGYGLKLWDAWRPPEVQVSLHQHGGYTGMFTDPAIMWSRHCSGTAVDVTLVDAKGKEVEMPTGYDEGGPKSHYRALVPATQASNRALLQMAMGTAGFSILDTEWWHFDDAAFNSSPTPPAVFAKDIGLALPEVKRPKVIRPYVYPTTATPGVVAIVPASAAPVVTEPEATVTPPAPLYQAPESLPATAVPPTVPVPIPTVPAIAPGL